MCSYQLMAKNGKEAVSGFHLQTATLGGIYYSKKLNILASRPYIKTKKGQTKKKLPGTELHSSTDKYQKEKAN